MRVSDTLPFKPENNAILILILCRSISLEKSEKNDEKFLNGDKNNHKTLKENSCVKFQKF